MYDLYCRKLGGILGDDMGLGKTVQVVVFLNLVFGKDGTESDWRRMRQKRSSDEIYPRVLIVCPGSLMDNWTRELNTWSWTHVDKYHGASKAVALSAIKAGRLEVLLTTYHTYRIDAQLINDIRWDVVIADECHIIKEKQSKVTETMNGLNARCRIGLTGTAIQNNYDELWTLLNWTNPTKFGSSQEWSERISSVLKNGQKYNATNAELSSARKKALELCNHLLPPFFLRRTKALIAHQLPKKKDRAVFCPLTTTQIEAYQNLMQSEEVRYLREAQYPCECGSGSRRLLCCHAEAPSGKSFAQLLFPYLLYFVQLSNHLALILPNKADPDDKRERSEALLKIALPDRYRELVAKPTMINGCDQELCGKWKVLRKLLRHWKREGAKVLVFSSSVKLLNMLNDLMTQESYSYEFLHGGMTLPQRSAAVDNFNDNPEQFVFLISTKAGGVGLNITSANKVVIFDPNWNPAHDLQAQDRAYRIGQSRDVDVYRLISVGTLEEVVYARQIYKQQQANIGYNASTERRYFTGVQGDTNQKGELFGVENLLSFHGENHVLREIFTHTSVAERQFDIQMATIEVPQHEVDATTMDSGSGSVKDSFGITSVMQELNVSMENAQSKIKEQVNELDSVAAILASAGVEYSHQNSEVVGSSEIEAAITLRATEAAMIIGKSAMPAYSLLQNPAGKSEYQVGNVPIPVQKRHFRTMAKTLGFKSCLDLALAIKNMNQDKRRGLLALFYQSRKIILGDLKKGQDSDIDVEKEQTEGHKSHEEDGGDRDRGAAHDKRRLQDLADVAGPLPERTSHKSGPVKRRRLQLPE